MSALCQNFVQNAWKKDLCSNCFKSKDEHSQNKTKPTPIDLNKSVEGIIRNNEKTKPKRTVEFTEHLSEVIGYGGEDWSSDLEEEETNDDDSNLDDEWESTDGDEEKELQKLTKANTDFNASSLQEVVSEVKKTYAQLMLGKPQLDSAGKKQTLLVSVTPFGQESTNNSKKYTKTVSHIPVAKNNNNSKDIALIESKNNVILTSYTKKDKEEKSLLDEISETLENSKNPIQIISRKKIEKEVILSKPEIIMQTSNKENVDNSKKIEEIMEITKSDGKLEVKLAKSNIPERKNGLTRTPVIKKDQEKPVIYQTSVAKIELMNTKNLKLSNSKENLSNKNLSKFNHPPKSETISPTPPSPDQKRNQNEIKSNEIIDLKRVSSQNVEEDISNKDANNSSDESLVSVSSNDEATRHMLEETMKDKPKKAPQPPTMTNHDNSIVPQSREQAGEPDGRADPEDIEPPALPLTPPPILDSHTSFLHNNKPSPVEKPKVPSKPATIILRKSPTNIAEHPPVILSSFISDTKANDISKTKLEKQDSNGSDIYKSANKRRAPQPPPSNNEDLAFYARHPMNAEAAIARDKERKERASSCSPDMSIVNESTAGFPETLTPEPAPRRSLSLSTDSLTSGAPDEKKKEKRGRFSLKKFLRMGSSKDLPKLTAENNKPEDIDPLPHPKPRLVIVHPLELNGAKVEVVSKSVKRSDTVDYCHMAKQANGVDNYNQRALKPPPPPRNYDEWHYSKPNIPHPPKSQDILNKQKEYSIKNGNNKKIETVYANIGEVRSAIIPNKPHRTASMREREALQQKQQRTGGNSNNYEPINLPNGKDSSENVYDYISSARSSSPECDSNKDSPSSKAIRLKNGLSQRSESSVDVSGDYFKYQNIPRSMSLTYCGSETESEIYSPYSFYGSESEVTEDDHEWSNQCGKTHKLRSRKGRSIVHKNLEDNYGAVIVANHEALAQVLENIQQNTTIQPALRGMKTASNLRWTDFTIKSSIPPVIIGPRAFHQAVWGTQHVTLVISTGPTPSSSLTLGMFSLVPVTEFSDLIPIKYVPVKETDEAEHLQATVAVLPWMQIHTLQSYGEIVKSKLGQNSDEAWKDTNFVLLQLVNALKTLQAQGIEELPLSLSTFVLCKEVDKDSHYKLYVLQGLGEDLTRKSNAEPSGTLCMCATSALRKLQATARLSTLLQSLLSNERAVSLTQVKSVLEFSLWGPSDVALGSTVRERELALQRWLDLQRATVLHGLVCTKVHLTVHEECHLLFLVRSNARMMCDASMLLESSNKQNYVMNVQK